MPRNTLKPNTCRSELVIAITSRQQFVGTAAHLGDEIDGHAQADACDRFIPAPHLSPQRLDDVVDQGLPLLQQRGPLRTHYRGHTPQDRPGLTADTQPAMNSL